MPKRIDSLHVCPDCGGRKYAYSATCRGCYAVRRNETAWTDAMEEFMREHYPHQGVAWVAERLGVPPGRIPVKAKRLGLKLTAEANHRVVHDKAAEYMRENNPSRLPGASERIAARTRESLKNPKYARALFEGHARLRKTNPTKLEAKLAGILDSLGVDYEPQVVVKSNFVIDFLAGRFVIEADGDWWHGHPRFPNLTERQEAQKRRDAARNAYLTACGYTVIRIWESDTKPDFVKRVLQEYGVIAADEPVRPDPTA